MNICQDKVMHTSEKIMQREDMENYSYEEAIAELEKLLRFDFVET